MRGWAGLAAAACLWALACGRGGYVKAEPPVVAAPPPAAGVSSINPDAARAEALLEGADIPFAPRSGLTPKVFPAGCFWLAGYAAGQPEVMLETFAFTSVEAAENYVTNRNADFDAGPPGRSHIIVNNGSLVLVAWFAQTGVHQTDADAYGVMSVFAAAFVK